MSDSKYMSSVTLTEACPSISETTLGLTYFESSYGAEVVEVNRPQSGVPQETWGIRAHRPVAHGRGDTIRV